MKRIISASIISICFFVTGFVSTAQEVVELKQPVSDKIIIKLMFRNGSVVDPAGREGLTQSTTSLITSGGTKDMTSRQIREFYPMAASYFASTDKEVSIFTFTVHKDFLENFIR